LRWDIGDGARHRKRPAVRPLTFTVYRTIRDNQGTPVTRTWDQWLEVFTTHRHRGSPLDTNDLAALDHHKNGISVVLGLIPSGTKRSKRAVREVHALSLDLEGIDDAALSEILTKRLLPYEWVCYTTHKSGANVVGGGTRLRVILPLVEPISPEDHREAWDALDTYIEHRNDPSTKDASRLNLLPSTFDPAFARAHHHRGRWLDWTEIASKKPGTTAPKMPAQNLHALRHALLSVGDTEPMRDVFRALVHGEAFAGPGSRHNTIRDLTWALAARRRPPTEEVLLELFAPSLEAMRVATPGDPPTMDEVITAYRSAVEKLEEDRSAEQIAAREARITAEQETRAAAGLRAQHDTEEGPYTAADLERIAGVQGCTVEDLAHRWIIGRDGVFWLLDQNGTYQGPYSTADAEAVASRILARSPVRLIDATQQGYRYRAFGSLLRESGAIATKVIADLNAQSTRYDAGAKIIHEAVCPRRPIEPKHDPAIEEWLRILAGPQWLKLKDWLACAPDLNKLLCAIYFEGPPGAGKTIFAHGIARLWDEGPPTKPENVFGGFNDDLARCPVVFADEKIARRWNQDITTDLREMIGSTQRTLDRKYRKPIPLLGCVRMILAANNKSMLDSRDVASAHDLSAIAQRFLHIAAPARAVSFLEEIPKNERQRWMHEGIAAYMLWLEKHYHVENPGRRFWVEGEIDEMHRILVSANRINSLVNQVLVGYLMTPTSFDQASTGYIRRGGGRLLVNAQAVIALWDIMLPQTKQEPELAKINAALRAISLPSQARPRLRWKDRNIRYHEIDVDNLLAYSDREGLGDRHLILERINEGEDPNQNAAGIPAHNPGDLPL
jgi:hypothetical protein